MSAIPEPPPFARAASASFILDNPLVAQAPPASLRAVAPGVAGCANASAGADPFGFVRLATKTACRR